MPHHQGPLVAHNPVLLQMLLPAEKSGHRVGPSTATISCASTWIQALDPSALASPLYIDSKHLSHGLAVKVKHTPSSKLKSVDHQGPRSSSGGQPQGRCCCGPHHHLPGMKQLPYTEVQSGCPVPSSPHL